MKEVTKDVQDIINRDYTTLSAIVKQLEWGNYENQAGYLVNNIAFTALKQMAEREAKTEEEVQKKLTSFSFEAAKELHERGLVVTRFGWKEGETLELLDIPRKMPAKEALSLEDLSATDWTYIS